MDKTKQNQLLSKALIILLIIDLFSGLFAITGCDKKEAEKPFLEKCTISHELEFGGVYIDLPIDDFNKRGFSYGDSVNVTFSNGYKLESIPYYNGYYTQNGQPLLVAYPGYPYIKVCINNGDDLWTIADLTENDTASITLDEPEAYLDVQNARDIHYEDEREKYSSDEVFANFRAVSVAGMKKNILFRSASPCDNQHNRAVYVDRLIEEAGVNTIIDLADNDEKIENYIAADDFDSPYFLSLYERGSVCPLALKTNFESYEFQEKLAKVMNAIIEHDGPYLVHCTEGKDRTGFVCMLLEAFCGATYKEIVEDYMITYDNYYQISITQQKTKYDTIVKDVFNPMVLQVVGYKDADPESVDLEECAVNYMQKIGFKSEQIKALKERLCEEM